MAGERHFALKPISRRSKALKDASRAGAADGQRKRRFAGVSRHVVGLAAHDGCAAQPEHDLLYPPGCHDCMDRFHARSRVIRDLEAMGADKAATVAFMTVYNAAEAGDADAVRRLPDLMVAMMDAMRSGLPPPPPGYWKRHRTEPSEDEPWI